MVLLLRRNTTVTRLETSYSAGPQPRIANIRGCDGPIGVVIVQNLGISGLTASLCPRYDFLNIECPFTRCFSIILSKGAPRIRAMFDDALA